MKSRFFRPVLAIVITLLLLIAGWFFLSVLTDPYDCRIAEGVTIDGVAMGGLTKGEARKVLKAAAEKTVLT